MGAFSMCVCVGCPLSTQLPLVAVKEPDSKAQRTEEAAGCSGKKKKTTAGVNV